MKLNEIFCYVVSLSLMGSILAFSILIIKRLFRQKLGANWHYGIWFVLLVRLLIPYIPTAPFTIFNIIPHYQQVVDLPNMSMPSYKAADTTYIANTVQTADSSANKSQQVTPGNNNLLLPKAAHLKTGFSWTYLGFIWSIGIAVILMYIFLVNSLMLLKIRKLPVCYSEDIKGILQECKSSLNLHTKVSIIYDDTLKSPAIFGLFSKGIIISPRIIKELTPEELRYIFMHELSHIKRHDLLINGLALITQVIYWFNPIVVYSLYQMKQDCEIACDATALAALKQEDHKKYGKTIISLLQLLSEPQWAPGTLGFVSKFNTRRITMISSFKKTTTKWVIVTLALILLVGCSSLNSPVISSATRQNQTDSAANNTLNTDTASSQQSADTTAPTLTLPSLSESQQSSDNNTAAASTLSSSSDSANVYNNTQYSFNFTLTDTWKGYSVIVSQWEGSAFDGDSGEKVVETGPIITIRDPRWISKSPRQDIPIMIFTLDQWKSLQKGAFHIGAAPVGPSELGRNNKYVFALPARYNASTLPGFEEVETIMASNPLAATQAP